jgi:hypothetical protein
MSHAHPERGWSFERGYHERKGQTVSVGSGDLFGTTQTRKVSEMKSVSFWEITRRIFSSLERLRSMTTEYGDRKARLFFSTSDTEADNF